MLIMEPLDPANIVDISADLPTPFDYLTIQRHRRGTTLTMGELKSSKIVG
jgi:hypothetical protein